MTRVVGKLWFLAPVTILSVSITAASARTMPEAYGKLPLSFEPNQGRTSGQVKFLSRGPGYTLFLTSTEAVLALRKGESAPSVVRMTLIGANKNSRVIGVDSLPGRSNYFIGSDPKKWRTGVPHYAKVHYREVYPGVDLFYYGKQRQLEYDFVVSPGADSRAIVLAFSGAGNLAVDGSGDLILNVAGGEIRLHAPFAYQQQADGRIAVPAKYVLDRKRRVRFEVAAYDTTRPLVIDPVLVVNNHVIFPPPIT